MLSSCMMSYHSHTSYFIVCSVNNHFNNHFFNRQWTGKHPGKTDVRLTCARGKYLYICYVSPPWHSGAVFWNASLTPSGKRPQVIDRSRALIINQTNEYLHLELSSNPINKCSDGSLGIGDISPNDQPLSTTLIFFLAVFRLQKLQKVIVWAPQPVSPYTSKT